MKFEIMKLFHDGYLKRHVREQTIGTTEIQIADIFDFTSGFNFKSISLPI